MAQRVYRFRRTDSSQNTGHIDSEGSILPKSMSERDRVRRIGRPLVILAAMGLLYLLLRPNAREGAVPPPGSPSPKRIVATFDFDFVDEEAYSRAQQRAAELEPPIFLQDMELPGHRLNLLDNVFAAAAGLDLHGGAAVESPAEALFDRFPEIQLTVTDWTALIRYRRDLSFLEAVKGAIRDVWHRVVPSEREMDILRASPRGFRIRGTVGNTVDILSSDGILTVDEARRIARETLRQRLPSETDPLKIRLADNLVNHIVRPDLIYDDHATYEIRNTAAGNVPVPVVHVRKGEVIAERGSLLTPLDVKKWKEWLRVSSRKALGPHAGSLLLAVFSTMILLASLRRYHPGHAFTNRFLIVVLGLCLLVLACAVLLDGMQARLTEPYRHIPLVLPVASVGMLVTALLGGNLALMMVTIVSILASEILAGGLSLALVYLFAGLAAVYKVVRIKRRTDFYMAAIWSSAAAVLMFLTLQLRLSHESAVVIVWQKQFSYGAFWAGLSGIISAGITMFLLPLLESFLGITTDLRLIEFSVRNQALRDLERFAPGTYQHSIHVGTLAESAAESIGANALLCRVASLYHDIGKMEKPQYFSENQVTQSEKKAHAKMTPNLSCLLIRNHVKDGLELAERIGLPQPLRDVIQQHHGTTLISFFYDKALSENPGTKIKESDFRYSGPKPQTVESGIVMLADSIEASSRSLTSYSMGEIRLLVRKVINDKFMDNQFDECDLTLKDLHTLANSFATTLASLLHRRISYPSTEAALSQKREKAKAPTREGERPEPVNVAD